MAKLTIIEFSVQEWNCEGFYHPTLNIFAFREDVPLERRNELIKKYMN